MDGLAPEQIKRLQYRYRLRNDEHLPYHTSQIERVPGQKEVEEVFFPDNADHVFDRSMADQEPGEIAGEHAVSNLLGIVVRIDPCDIAAGGHDGADWPICQPENAFDHPSLHLLENAAFGAFGNQADDLLLGDRLIASRLHAKEPQHHPRGPAKPGDHRPTYARDEPHRPCDARC